MKVLLIDKNLVDPINHYKWGLLAQRPNIKLTAITPEVWFENFRELRFMENPDTPFSIIPLPVIWPGYENRGFYFKGLKKKIKISNPDVIIVFEEPCSLFALQSIFIAKKVVPHAKIFLYTFDNLSGGIKYGYRPRWLYKSVERYTMSHADMLLAANQEAVDRFSDRYPTKVEKLYFGIDTRSFNNGEKEATPQLHRSEYFNVGYIGRLLLSKGIDTLIEAVALLPESVRLILVGNGPDNNHFAHKIHKMGLSKRVVLQGAVASHEVPNYFTQFDVFVLPSKTTPTWKEQYGRVLVEAMANGIPIVGSSSGAIPEVVGKAGIIFPEGNEKELASCIEKLRTNEVLRLELSSIGKERAALFSADRFAGTLYNLMRRLVHE